MNPNEVILMPPGGVTVNQWKNGALHFRLAPEGYGPLGVVFAQLAVQCKTYAEAYKSHVAAKQQAAPVDPVAQARIAEMEAEIARLRQAGAPVSVITSPAMTAAQQLEAILQPTAAPVVQRAPTVHEVAAAMASRGVQHPAAAMMQQAVPAPIVPPANVPPQPPLPMFVPAVSTEHQNPGPMPEGLPIHHVPILKLAREAAGTPAPDAPATIISGGAEQDDGELGPPPTTI